MTTLSAAVRSALLRVADNVAKHTVQRSGFSPDDPCFLVDLKAAEEELLAAARDAILADRKAAGAAIEAGRAHPGEPCQCGECIGAFEAIGAVIGRELP